MSLDADNVLGHSPMHLRSPAERGFLVASSADRAHLVVDGHHRPKRTLRNRRHTRGQVAQCTGIAFGCLTPSQAAG